VYARCSRASLASTVPRASASHSSVTIPSSRSSEPLPWFFLDRYLESYRQEWRAFHAYLSGETDSPAGTEAARACTKVALAARLSWREGRPVRISEIG